MNYFISYALRFKDNPISHFGNIVIDLPHEIKDSSDIEDIQKQLATYFENSIIVILSFNKL